MVKYRVIIKSPASYYGSLFKGRVQVVEPAFATRKQAQIFILKNQKFDRMLKVAYRYSIRKTG